MRRLTIGHLTGASAGRIFSSDGTFFAVRRTFGVARRLLNDAVVSHETAELPRTSVVEALELDSHEELEEPAEPRLWFRPVGKKTGISLRNSLTGRKEELVLKGRAATWYMCGPTVYDDAHVGHASCCVRFDVIRRILTEFFDIDVVFVMCVTDIDDKIISRAKILQQSAEQLAQHYESRFLSDLRLLNVLPPAFSPRVSDFIPQIIAFVQRLVEAGRAYESHGSVYFDLLAHEATSTPHPRLRPPLPVEGAAPFVGAKNRSDEKRDSRDFAVWKASRADEPGWDSPWGKGRPGWHVECSAMASAVFGDNIDIHSGGRDLLFPHHENEITQCHAYHDCKQWVNYWLHAGSLVVGEDETKMSKSLKNTISVPALLQAYSANQFRMLCIGSHYRSQINFSSAKMYKAAETLHQIESFLHLAQMYMRGKHVCGQVDVSHLKRVLESTKNSVAEALADDFDTPTALEHLKMLVHEGNVELSKKVTGHDTGNTLTGVFASYISYIKRTMSVFGMTGGIYDASTSSSSAADTSLETVLEWLVDFRSAVRGFALDESDRSESEVVISAEAKAEAKKRRRATLAERRPLLEACDRIRERLAGEGIQILDQSRESLDVKSSWKRVDPNVVEHKRSKKDVGE